MPAGRRCATHIADVCALLHAGCSIDGEHPFAEVRGILGLTSPVSAWFYTPN